MERGLEGVKFMSKETKKNESDFHKEFSRVTLYLCIRSVAMGLILLYAAIYFDKWWILLGTLCFIGSASMKSDSGDDEKTSIEIKGEDE